jgi:sugar transferase (PEP-CTERM/EpsH1 system associated)
VSSVEIDSGRLMTRPRILALASRVPYPLAGGDRLRVYHVLRGLQRAGDVELLSLSEGPPDASAVTHLREQFARVTVLPFHPLRFRLKAVRAVVTPGEPIQVGYYRFASVQAWVDEALQRSDLAFAFHVRMTDYLASTTRPRMVDLVDAISMNYRRALQHQLSLPWRMIYRTEIPRLERYEVETTRRFDRSYVVADADREYLVQRGASGERLQVLGNGTVGVRDDQETPVVQDLDLVFVGHMGTQANQAAVIFFVREVLPILHRRGLRPTLSIVGIQPGENVRALAREGEVTVTGEVPDPLEFVRRAKVVLAPMIFGAGVQNKILEGMAMARPVVTTTLGAEGLEVESGVHLLVADGPEAIADAVARSLADPELRRRLGMSAARRVRERYSWNPVYDQIAADVDRCLNCAPRVA